MGFLKKVLSIQTLIWSGYALGIGVAIIFLTLQFFALKFDYDIKDIFILVSIYPYIITFCAISLILSNTIVISILNYNQKYNHSFGFFLATLILGCTILFYKLYFFNLNSRF